MGGGREGGREGKNVPLVSLSVEHNLRGENAPKQGEVAPEVIVLRFVMQPADKDFVGGQATQTSPSGEGGREGGRKGGEEGGGKELGEGRSGGGGGGGGGGGSAGGAAR